MTTHTPTIDVSQDQPLLPNQHFSLWLRGQTTLFISQIAAILGFITLLASLIYYVSHISEQSEFVRRATNAKLIVDYTHVVFMAVFILALIQILDDNERGSYHAKLVYERVFNLPLSIYKKRLKKSKGQLRKFKRRFLWFWIGMLFLYVSLACQQSYKLATESQETSDRNVEFSASYRNKGSDGKETNFRVDLSSSTVDSATSPEPEYTSNRSDALKYLAFPFAVFLFNNLTMLSVFQCFLVMYIPSHWRERKELKFGVGRGRRRGRKLKFRIGREFQFWIGKELKLRISRDLVFRIGSFVIVAMLTFLYVFLAYIKGGGKVVTDDWDAYSSIFDSLSGVINAIVLALLVARLDSKLIGLPSWLISILYSYAAVQPLIIVFELHPQVLQKIATLVLIFVFLSKVYFFLIIIYALQTGRMLNYLFCFPILKEAIESEYKKKPKPEKPAGGRATVSRRRSNFIPGFLRSDWPLKISKWFGLAAICHFFISLVSSRVIPYIANLYSDVLNVHFDVAQMVAVSVMIVTLHLVWKDNDYDESRVADRVKNIFNEAPVPRYSLDKGKEQLKKFKKYFLWFWYATLLLYLVFLLDHLEIYSQPAKEGSPQYLIEMSKHVVMCSSKKVECIEFMGKILLFPFLEFFLSSLNLLCIFWCFVILQSPALNDRSQISQKRLVNYSGFIIALLVAVFPLLLFLIGGPARSEPDMRAYATVFNGVTGMLSAVALALLIARMDGKLFGLPSWSWSTRILFAYASIQPLFIAFVLKDDVLKIVQSSVLITAFVFKICFFLIVAYSLQSGKVLNYLVCFTFLRDSVDSIFENQFEIRLTHAEAHLFTFSILKKNQLYYSTTQRLKSREECDGFVHYLRALMKEENAYLVPPLESGTYWVEVRTLVYSHLLCESVPLRSEEEAKDLRKESIDKIPYCKYNRT